MKNKVSFRRPFVDPQSEKMAWSAPGAGLAPDAVQVQRPSVKFTDMQTDFKSGHELDKDI